MTLKEKPEIKKQVKNITILHYHRIQKSITFISVKSEAFSPALLCHWKADT